MAEKNGILATVTQTRIQAVLIKGKQLEHVKRKGSFLEVSARPPRRSKAEKIMYPMSQVHSYLEGEGGRMEPAFARLHVPDTLTIVGNYTRANDGSVTVSTKDGDVYFAPGFADMYVQIAPLSDVAREKFAEKSAVKKKKRVVKEAKPVGRTKKTAEATKRKKKDWVG